MNVKGGGLTGQADAIKHGISKALVDAKERGVKVRVILDATAATNGYSKHNYLRENGIDVKVESWGGKMHMKAAVFDKKHVVVGSMNWTKAGEKKNDENTIIIKNSPKHANQLFFSLKKCGIQFQQDGYKKIPIQNQKNLEPLVMI